MFFFQGQISLFIRAYFFTNVKKSVILLFCSYSTQGNLAYPKIGGNIA